MARSAVPLYVAVFVALIVLTGVTVAVSYVDLGPASVVVALALAGVKAVLVLLFFLHLREGPGLTWLVAVEKGWDGVLAESVGGGYRVQVPAYGGLFRIAGRDADALGLEPGEAPAAGAGGDLEEQVLATLKTCFDPEIPVNIVDLGLVY